MNHGDGPPPAGGPGSGGAGQMTGGNTYAMQPLNTAAGIALSGAYIFNALAGTTNAAGNLDAVEAEGATLDVCLSHPTPNSEYHYHYWTPCAKSGFSLHDSDAAPALCRDTTGCTSDPYSTVKTTSVNEQPLLFTPERWD